MDINNCGVIEMSNVIRLSDKDHSDLEKIAVKRTCEQQKIIQVKELVKEAIREYIKENKNK